MIGQYITDPKTGEPLTNSGNRLSESKYQPPQKIKDLFSRVQQDYQVSYALQHRTFDEFDGMSLLDRTRADQGTFATFVGCEYVEPQKRWRWKGRKNTSRNKIMSILAHIIAGMLYPFVYAKDEQGEEDKLSAKVMRILIEDSLRKASYEIKFMHMALSALVNPAVIVNVEWVESMQRIKVKLASGEYSIKEVIDELVSGLNLNIVPVDELLLADFYSTGDIQKQPYIVRVRRISYDSARSKYAGKYELDGEDVFNYVQAGMTRIMLAGQENQTLFDIEWTEADGDFVQELIVQYRGEDLEVAWVGGVFMGEHDKNPYECNAISHRRLQLIDNEWCSIPVYPYAMSGFEPIDPTGRFSYFKSAAFKEYWDDRALNQMHRLALDGTSLDVMKPMLLPGVAQVNSDVIAPGAVVGIPAGSVPAPYQLGPNLKAAYDAIETTRRDLSESTQDPIMGGQVDKGVTAYATQQAESNARKLLGNFGLMISYLITSVGQLCLDLEVQHATMGQIDTTVPGKLGMKFKARLAKGKEKGRNMSNQIIFTDSFMGKQMTDDEIEEKSWELYDKTGKDSKDRESSEKRIFEVNPYAFARMSYTLYVDPDMIVRKSVGLDRQEKLTAFNIMTDPRVAPFTDQKAVIDDFAIEEYGGDDPERYKKKDMGGADALSMMMGQQSPPVNGQGGIKPMNINQPELQSIQ